jgi:hypothetical protein
MNSAWMFAIRLDTRGERKGEKLEGEIKEKR